MDRRILIAGAAVVAIGIVLWISPKGKEIKVEPPAPEQVSAAQLYEKASVLEQKGNILQAQETYHEILNKHSDFGSVEKVEKDLEALNMQLVFSNTDVPQKSVRHEVKSGDTLGGLAKKYGTTIDLIKRNNNLSGDVIRIGQKLRIWNAPFNIFIDKSQNILLLKEGENVVKVYTVSTGAGNSTPVGDFTIISKLVDPVWFHKGIVVPPESPQNALGSRWLGFDTPGYGIHGTIEPETIGQQVTAGCVRMLKDDVEELYSIIPTGTKVSIVD